MASESGHGGRRAGAGRKKTGKRVGGPHRKRPALSSKRAVHVVLRVGPHIPPLRQRSMYNAIRRALLKVIARRADFRIVHVSIQQTHLHLIVEADDARALTRGMQSLAINLARSINAVDGRCGKVFTSRYHATQIVDGRQARNTLAYVLNNWRRHREDIINGRFVLDELDLYSTAGHFAGWSKDVKLRMPAGYEPLPADAPTTNLLLYEWKRFGRIDPLARPGPLL